jgi:hypothetical protein
MISILPLPQITNAMLNDTLCSGAATQTLVFTGANLYEWTISGDVIDGLPTAPQTGNFGTYTVRNTGTAAQTAKITVTPKYVYGDKTCIGTDTSFSITVDPIPELQTVPSDYILCSGDATQSLVLGTGITYSWEAATGSAYGFPSGTQTGDIGGITLNNQTANPAMVTVKISPQISGNCSLKDTSFVITIVPEPTITNTLYNDALCDGGKTTPITFEGTQTSYQWTAIGNIASIPPSGTSNFGTYTVINKSETTLQTTVTIKPKYAYHGMECTGNDYTFDVMVYATTAITSITPNSHALCQGDELRIELQAVGEALVF